MAMGKMVGDKYSSSPDISDNHEKKVVNEFCHLLEKSKQLFNQLRSVSLTADETYFTKSFDVYTRLWKYQQEHREILDRKYSLKRWQIGEIASKIGQLYYHYYLRTSDLNYLNEAFSFYSAIKGRGYFQLEERVELRIKKLRYYCRFIIVTLLLGRHAITSSIFQELRTEIEEYSHKYEPEDQLEWSIVLNEIKSFVQAETLHVLNRPHSFSHRIKCCSSDQRLQEAIIIGNKCDQIKFSELTLDMFRMAQILERENADSKNPKKYLLFRASVENVLVYLSNAFHNLDPKNVLLLYFSADGAQLSQGGLQTSKEETTVNCFYASDLVSYTRKPMCLIIESENSFAFQVVYEKCLNPACVLFLSMQELPPIENCQKGSLFTLFLYDPIAAFCAISSVTILTNELYEATVKIFRKFVTVATAFVSATRPTEDMVCRMMCDDFLRELTVRYIFCELCLRMRKTFDSDENFPKSYPNLNLTVKLSQSQSHNEKIGTMQRIVLDLCDCLAVSDFFFVDYLRAV